MSKHQHQTVTHQYEIVQPSGTKVAKDAFVQTTAATIGSVGAMAVMAAVAVYGSELAVRVYRRFRPVKDETPKKS